MMRQLTKARPYLVAALTLLLLAMPWLPAAKVKAATDKPMPCCCKNSAQSCCSTTPTSSDDSPTQPADDGCGCTMTALPAIPAVPHDVQEHRVDTRSDYLFADALVIDRITSHFHSRFSTLGESPPRSSARPAFLLFSALLI